jgi:Ca2+:H+ antiporter
MYLRTVSLFALIPLEKLLQFCSHQSILYLGHSVGDVVNVTLMKYAPLSSIPLWILHIQHSTIEAILAILLLRRDCQLRLLQSTVVGVILLQLLLVPGVMFFTGGSRVKHQALHASRTQLNQSMMTMGYCPTA